MRGRDPATGQYIRLSDPEDRAITAAVATIAAQDIERLPRMAADWQVRAWRLWRILGVLHYPTSFKAKQVGRLKWKVTVDGKELDEEQGEEVVKAVTSPLTPREAARRLALNYEVAGEVYYARTQDAWDVSAATAPKLKERLKGADIVVRSWQPDPEYPDKPTSSIQAALDTFEQIRLMCAVSRSQDRNRLAQRGILLVPKEGQFPEGDDFQSMLEESMVTPISDEYAGSAVVPLKVDYPADLIEKWRHLLIESPYDEKLMDRIDACIRKVALELDMPPEILLGNLDSNHWNAWLSSEENYRAHVEPLGQAVAEVFAEAAMRAVPGTLVEIEPDASELLMRRLDFADAIEALKLAVVGFEYVRDIAGIPEHYAPTAQEIDLILALTRGREQVQAVGVPAAGGGENVGPPELPPPTGTPATQAPPGSGAGSAPAPSPVAASANGTPSLDDLGRRLTDIDIRLLSVLEGLAQMAIDHARAGRSDDPVATKEEVAREMARLASAWRRELGRARKTLRGLGIDATGPAWDAATDRSVHLLEDTLTAWTVQNIDKTDAQMPALPVLILRRVLAAAGGSGSATVASANGSKP